MNNKLKASYGFVKRSYQDDPTPRPKPKPKLKPMPTPIRGYCYVAIGAEIDSDLKTSYIVKVGKGNEPVKRCDNQRLKIIGYASNNAVMRERALFGKNLISVIGWKNLEDYLLEKIGRKQPKLGYKPAGYTEMVGEFATAEEAKKKAREILDIIEEEGDREVYRWYEGMQDWRA